MKALTITLALVGIVAGAQAEGLRSQIIKGDAAFSRAMKANDMAEFTKIMKESATADFKYSGDGQTMGLDKMIQMMKMGMSAWKHVDKAEAHLLSLKESGTRATARTRHTMAGSVIGPDKKSHRMTFSGDSSDTYVKVGGKWKMSSMTWGKTVQTMDGKPVKM